MDDISQGEALRILPLDAWHRANGGRMVPFAGYEMPVQYEGIIAEHRWTRESAGLFDVSHMGQFHISGADAERELEKVLPADLALLKEGRPRYSLLLTPDGGILDDLMITRRGDHFYMVVNGATKEADLAYLTTSLSPSVVVDHMKEQALLALQGPAAEAALARLAPEVADLTFMTAAAVTIAGTRSWISRSGYTGEDGFEISLPATNVRQVADLLLAQPEVKLIGLGARDSLRLEAGLPLYGHDLDLGVSPVEAGLSFAISKRRRDEGGFAGWHRIARELADEPTRLRVGMRVEGRQPVREGALVVDEAGAEIGKITSGGFSPTLEYPIAMGFVPAALAAPGTRLSLSQRGRTYAAEITEMPFVPHRYRRKGER